MSDSKIALPLAVVTVSDTRTVESDKSGGVLVGCLEEAGHKLHSKQIVKDDVYQLRAEVSRLIADPGVKGVLMTGGTGFTDRDNTLKAIQPLLEQQIEGFGELFRQLSYDDIGTSTIQSRALGGLANGTLIFSLPGSSGAVTLGWEKILHNQLDIDFRPCNFAELIPRFLER